MVSTLSSFHMRVITGVYAGLEEPHGAGVAENVGHDPLVAQRGAGPLSDDGATLAPSERLRTPRSSASSRWLISPGRSVP